MSAIIPPAHAAVADVLDKAANHIDRVGWTQHYLYDVAQADTGIPFVDCRVCADGAILAAVYGLPRPGRHENDDQLIVVAAAEDALHRHVGYSFVAWNDQPERTQDEVTAALREAACKLRGAAA